jgi:hypothetical protein
MKTSLFALSLGFGAMILATQHAFAQSQNCAPHDVVVARLAEKYGETRQSIGIAQNNSVMEVFASLETRTWTITVTTPNGPTCMVAAGEAFERLEEALPAAGNPA